MNKIFKLIVISFLALLLGYLFLEWSKKEEVLIPEKITMLFVTQPSCPSCDALEKTMQLPKPKALLENYFEIKMVNLGEELPAGLISPNGTPTVYFLGANDVTLVEPMVGEKQEEALVEFLEDALLEFKNTYKVDLEEVALKKAELKRKSLGEK